MENYDRKEGKDNSSKGMPATYFWPQIREYIQRINYNDKKTREITERYGPCKPAF